VAKAREALRQKMKELEAQQPAPSVTPPPRVVTTPPSEPPPAVTPAPVPPEPNPNLSKAEQKKQAAAEAKARKEAQREAARAAADQARTGEAPKKAATSNRPDRFKSIQAPPLPISAEKQQRLAELLGKYRSNELTPEQYHEARAKVLAEP
jgi:hypothetical protein